MLEPYPFPQSVVVLAQLVGSGSLLGSGKAEQGTGKEPHANPKSPIIHTTSIKHLNLAHRQHLRIGIEQLCCHIKHLGDASASHCVDVQVWKIRGSLNQTCSARSWGFPTLARARCCYAGRDKFKPDFFFVLTSEKFACIQACKLGYTKSIHTPESRVHFILV